VLAQDYSDDRDGTAVRARFQANLVSMNERDRPFRLSASLGITIHDPQQGVTTIDDLLAEADKRMYAMKQHRHSAGTTPIPFVR
jgi:GGDEF domain-containing protein